MKLPSVELGAAIGISAFGIYQMHSQYQSVAPKLSDLRSADSDSLKNQQALMDADFLVGGMGLLAGLTASILSRSWIPLVTTVLAFAWLTYWYHAVQKAPSVDD
jgi:hypothetical protein